MCAFLLPLLCPPHRYFLATSTFGLGLDILNTVVSALSCVLYVVETYFYDPLTGLVDGPGDARFYNISI